MISDRRQIRKVQVQSIEELSLHRLIPDFSETP